MSFILQENEDSQINGSQTVFTTTNNISVITDVIFDGVPYIGSITVTGAKQVTLGNAPTVSLRISYYTSSPTGVVGNILVSDAITRLERQFNDSLGEISNSLYFDWFTDLNYMMYRIQFANDPTQYINEVPYSITAGTSAYSLPSDFKNMNVFGCGIYTNNNNTGLITSNSLIETGVGSQDTGFYLTQSAFVVTPVPTGASTVTMRYIPKITAITATTDYLVVNQEHFKMVIDFLDKEYGQWNLDTIKEQSADIRFQRGLEMCLQDTYRLPKVFILK